MTKSEVARVDGFEPARKINSLIYTKKIKKEKLVTSLRLRMTNANKN